MHPLLYEINARQWLAALSETLKRDIDLHAVPERELDLLEQRGVTHVWLMGVWPTGPKSRAEALRHPELRRAYDDALPGWHDDDVLGSPYAIGAAHVSPLLGGDAGLDAFRERLDERGIKLLLDFIPNHLGLDHPWVTARPELFVRGREAAPGLFAVKSGTTTHWIAHGKDPYFPPWTDTAQLDYRRKDTREEMLGMLRSIAQKCDGVRCDMSMLALPDVFEGTWLHLPLLDESARAHGDFWRAATNAIRAEQPGFLFLAEAYWDLEWRLCELGFDYAYDKKLYDHLAHDRPWEIQPHVLGMGAHNAQRAHFIENHDEPRAVKAIPAALQKAAALLVLGLPGMRFLHDGQLEGAKRFARIQLAHRADEPTDAGVAQMYADLLANVTESAVGRGDAAVLTPRAAWDGNHTHKLFTLVQWQVPGQADRFDLVVVNPGDQRAQCWAPLSVAGLAGARWQLADRLGPERYERDGGELASKGLYLDVPPRAAQLFAFRRG